MFNQQQYVNNYIKDNYKTIKLRIRKDDALIMNKLSDIGNVNGYLTQLILDDIYRNRKYNFINNEITIDFEVSKGMQYLIDEAEKADLLNNYGTYMNYADAIDTRAKNETKHHILSESQWKKLSRRYCL